MVQESKKARGNLCRSLVCVDASELDRQILKMMLPPYICMRALVSFERPSNAKACCDRRQRFSCTTTICRKLVQFGATFHVVARLD
jgi:hypothetical protein